MHTEVRFRTIHAHHDEGINNPHFCVMAQAVPFSGIWETKWLAKKASTAFTKRQLVQLASTGVEPCTSSSTVILGINQDSEIASSVATTPRIPVLVPKSKGCRIRMTTSAQVALGAQYDLSDSQTVNQGASTNDVVTAEEILSATEAVFSITKPQSV